MIAQEILDRVEKEVSALSPLVVDGVIDKMSKEVEKGHRNVDDCAYCTALRNYTRLRIKEKRKIRRMKYSAMYGPWPGEYSELNHLQSDVRQAKILKDSLK